MPNLFPMCFFADDSVLFCQATEMEAVNVNEVL